MRGMVIYPADESQETERRFPVETVAELKKPALEELFRRFNVVTGDPKAEDAMRLGIRSMSVGDMVEFDDESTYLCMPYGWKRLLPDEITKILGIKDFGKRSLACYKFGE